MILCTGLLLTAAMSGCSEQAQTSSESAKEADNYISFNDGVYIKHILDLGYYVHYMFMIENTDESESIIDRFSVKIVHK